MENKTRTPAEASVKVGKYFKYAIGEIILVVIGILIALQVNDWNSQKKDRKYEVTMLSEVVKSLETDKLHVVDMFKRITDLETTTNYFMNLSKNKVNYNDSVFYKIFQLNTGVSFQINSGPYQAIKSSGMDKVSNDSLRNSLIDFYDNKIFLFQSRFNHANRNYQDNIEGLLPLLGERYINTVNDINIVDWKHAPSNLFQQQQFLKILSDIVWRTRTTKGIFQRTQKNIQELIDDILIEINDD